jgi:hypothetical protein|tara:strand:- start:379 stop:621 length:243 start_codon:yes stop_codon:yes gene_type:complete
MSSELILIDEFPNNLIIMNENMYKYIVENIAINHFLILFTMSCTLGLVCCGKKRQEIRNKYIVIPSNDTEAVKGEVVEKV